MKNKIHKEKENSNTGKLNLDRGRKIKIKKLHKNMRKKITIAYVLLKKVIR